MHGNSDLGGELLQDLAGRVRAHRIGPINRDQRHIDAPDLVQLLGGEWMAQVAQVDYTESAEVEDEGGPFECSRYAVLVNRHVEDRDIAHVGTDAIPFRPELGQA